MVCIDTSFIIDIIKNKIDAEELGKLIDNEEDVHIASPSVIEIIRGLYLKRVLKNVKDYEINLINNLFANFNILELTLESAKIAGKIEAELINNGEQIGVVDVMIASICIENNETLITRNKKHFEKIKGLRIITY